MSYQNGEQKRQQKKNKGELIEKREKNVKHFINEDLSYQAVTYPQAVHFLKDGKYEDVDNTLEEKTDEDNQQVLENKNNNFKVKVAKNSKSKKLVKINKDKYDLSWGVDKVNVADDISKLTSQELQDSLNDSSVINLAGKKKEILDKLPTEKKKFLLPNVSSEVRFENIKDGIDLEYQIKAEKVKENIVLKKPVNDFSISFNYNSKTLVPELAQINQ